MVVFQWDISIHPIELEPCYIVYMKYRNVCIESFGYTLPPVVLTSEELEQQLSPLYERLGLVVGRLELMTGIRERRFWADGTLPSDAATAAARDALAKAKLPATALQCLLHCSVSRDFVEPSTSTVVHRNLGCPSDCMNFDISNACLGMASGLLCIANQIELGQIQCGIVVSGENGGPLVRNTIAKMNADLTLTRKSIKDQFASLTIGSCATAIVLCHASISRTGRKLLAAAEYADTAANQLCQGDASGGMTDSSAPLMSTDSQALLQQGVHAAKEMWAHFKTESGWEESTPDLICTHQVGKAHSALLFQTLGLNSAKDFTTYQTLGNCGSSSWPVTCALAEEAGRLRKGVKLAVLAIGSGINCTGLSIGC